MINGNPRRFIEELAYQDHCISLKDKKIYFNACQCKFDTSNKPISCSLEVYNLTDNNLLFSTEQANQTECIKELEKAKIFDGKTFWQVEKDMQWIDC